MRLFIRYATIYSFTEPQARLIELLRVTPGSFVGQNVIDWQIDVDCDARIKTGRDGHGNETAMLYANGPLRRIRIAVSGEVLTDDRAGMVVGAHDPLPPLLYTRPSPLALPDAALTALGQEAVATGGGTALGTMHALARMLHERILFDAEPRPNMLRTGADALATGFGVCQDHAHAMIAAARSLGFPARYVSGHLHRTDDVGPQPASHAWAEIFIEEYGWVAFDPVNAQCPDDRYVRVAVGLDYGDAAPLTGARVGAGSESLEVTVSVTRERPL